MDDKTALDEQLAELSERTGQLVFGILWTTDRPFLVVQTDPEAAAGLVEP